MHDAIELEKRGVPTVLLCTDQFIATAQATARIKGLPDYPFVVVPHPVGSLSQAGLMERAKLALPHVLELLLVS
ncbi:MAG: hypothetical protein HYX82_00700 [Chloroflexi bacterium]|nr:hypothetical protein [Chloroflexota bacterium]